VDQFFANCLLADNRAEVELSQLAEKQAQSSEVKQFAQMMVRDHEKMIQQLEQAAGSQGASSRGTSTTRSSTSSSENAGSNTISASGTSNVGGLSNSGTSSQSNSGTAESNTSGTNLPGSSGAGQTASRDATSLTSGSSSPSLTGATSSAGNDAVSQIGQIDRQIVDRKSQMMKEELQQKSGAEFDKCFVGGAVAAHTHALAALEVISQHSQGQLAQIAKQAQPTVQEHLERAKQLIKQLDSESGSSSKSTNQAERSTSRTER